MNFKMSLAPYVIGTLLLVVGVIAAAQGSGAGFWPALIAGVLLYILGTLLDIRSALERR